MAAKFKTMFGLALAIALLATACSDDPDFDDFLQANDQQVDFSDLLEGGGDGNGIDLSDLLEAGGDGNRIDTDALVEDLLGVSPDELQENPFALLCGDNDIASPPPGWPFSKPASMYAVGYDMSGNEYELRGTTDNPTAVIAELQQSVFPDAVFTVVSDIEGQQVLDFTDELGTGRYSSTSITGCTHVSIVLRVGVSAEEPAEAVSASSDSAAVAVGEGGDASSVEPAESGPDITVLAGIMVYELDATTCIIKHDEITINAMNDNASLTVIGTSSSIVVAFIAEGGTSVNLAAATPIVPIPGAMLLSDPQITISASECSG